MLLVGLVEHSALLVALVLRLKVKHGNLADEILHLTTNGRQRTIVRLLTGTLIQARQKRRGLQTAIDGNIGKQLIHLLQQALVQLLALLVDDTFPPVVGHQAILLLDDAQGLRRLSVWPRSQIGFQFGYGHAAVAVAELRVDAFQRVI